MSEECTRCAELGFRLSAMRGQVLAAAARIEAELDQATVGRRDLLELVQHQLEGVADMATGGV